MSKLVGSEHAWAGAADVSWHFESLILENDVSIAAKDPLKFQVNNTIFVI